MMTGIFSPLISTIFVYRWPQTSCTILDAHSESACWLVQGGGGGREESLSFGHKNKFGAGRIKRVMAWC